jgi:hypothetical protein
MTKVLNGLVKNPTFEELIGAGGSNLDDIGLYTRQPATSQRNFFFATQGDLVDEDHDDKVSKILSILEAQVQGQAHQAQARRADNARQFAAHLPGPNNEAEMAAPEMPPQTQAQPAQPVQPTAFGALGLNGPASSWKEREERRRQQYKPQPSLNHQERAEARRTVERARDLDARRSGATAQEFDIASPRQAPRTEMQTKYDQRTSDRKTPSAQRMTSARAATAGLTRSASQADRNTKRGIAINQKRTQAMYPPSAPPLSTLQGRTRSRNDTPPRGRAIGPLATLPR